MDEDVPLTHVSPLFMENHLHLLSDMVREEDAKEIATTLPPMFLVYHLPLPRNNQCHNYVPSSRGLGEKLVSQRLKCCMI